MDIRDEIVESVFKEIIGPSPNPNYIDIETGEEILLAKVHGSPRSRYGAGILYPQATKNIGEVNPDEKNETESEFIEPDYIPDPENHIENSEPSGLKSPKGEDLDEEPVGLANQYLPSAMGFTVRFKNNEIADKIVLSFRSAYYVKGTDKKKVKKLNAESKIETIKTKDGSDLLSDYWVRKPISIAPFDININNLFKQNKNPLTKVLRQYAEEKDWLKLQIFDRSTKNDEKKGYLTLTFVLINAIKTSGTDDTVNGNFILYQNELKLSTSNVNLISPYLERTSLTDTDEEREMRLLYRKKRVFAIGHGTAVKWNRIEDENSEKVTEIKTAVLPVFDIPQVAPTSDVELSMFNLSDIGNWSEAKNSLRDLAKEYGKWITALGEEAINSPELKDYREAARSNVEKCKKTLKRIQNGIDILFNAKEDSDILKCFLWMNRAMMWQQQRSKVKQRKWIRTGTTRNVTFNLEE